MTYAPQPPDPVNPYGGPPPVPPPPSPPPGAAGRRRGWLLGWALFIGLAILLLTLVRRSPSQGKYTDIPLSEFVSKLERNQVHSVNFGQDEITGWAFTQPPAGTHAAAATRPGASPSTAPSGNASPQATLFR